MTGNHVHQVRTIFGSACHGACLVEAGGVGDHAVTGNPPVGGLQAGNAAERRWLANGTTGIGTHGCRHKPCCHCRCAAAGATAGNGSEVPGVFDRAVVAVFVGGAHGELVHIGFTQANGARSAEFLYHGGVVRREKVIEHFGAAAGFDALRTKNIF